MGVQKQASDMRVFRFEWYDEQRCFPNRTGQLLGFVVVGDSTYAMLIDDGNLGVAQVRYEDLTYLGCANEVYA